LGVTTQRPQRLRHLLVGILSAAAQILAECLEGLAGVGQVLFEASDSTLDLAAGGLRPKGGCAGA
jgi:hypothetical protein